MACELVTGLGEEPHISAEQIGLFNVALVGAGDYLLNTQDKLAATIPTANSITIGTGDVSMQGRHITVPEPETLTIGSGTTGYNRIDLVVIRYTKDPVTGIEKTELDIIRGEATTGTPSEPSYTTGNIRTGGALLNELPIYRITISGITPQEPVLLLDNVLASLSQLQEGLAKLITTDRIQNGAVTNAKLADGSVNSAKIVDGGVASVDLANGAVTTAKIADGNVSLAKLASNSVNSSKIVDGSIVAADLANAAVTTAKIADKNITLAKLEQSLQNSISQTTGTFTKNANVKNGDFSLFKSGKLCFLRGSYINLAAALSGYSERNIGTVPSGFRPTIQSWGVGVQDNGSFAIKVNTDGSTLVRALDKQIGTSTSCWFLIVYYTA